LGDVWGDGEVGEMRREAGGGWRRNWRAFEKSLHVWNGLYTVLLFKESVRRAGGVAGGGGGRTVVVGKDRAQELAACGRGS